MNKLGPFELNSIVTGDCGNCLCEIPDESVTAVLCDPPYGLAFMGKGWDSFKTNTEFQAWVTTWAAELLRACVPGAVGLFFGGTRTFHRLACGLEAVAGHRDKRGVRRDCQGQDCVLAGVDRG